MDYFQFKEVPKAYIKPGNFSLSCGYLTISKNGEVYWWIARQDSDKYDKNFSLCIFFYVAYFWKHFNTAD